jgi:hypothetical protein
MFRFTIRELLLLTVIVAVVVAWRQDRSRLARLSGELKSRNYELAVMRTDLAKDPAHFFNMETARLREQLEKKGPLVGYLLRGRRTPGVPFDQTMAAMLERRQQLERDADAAGYIITISSEGPTLVPRWEGSWNESSPSKPNET